MTGSTSQTVPEAFVVATPELRSWVHGLVDALRGQGINATYDAGSPGYDAAWALERAVGRGAFVLLICNSEFRRAWDARTGFVGRAAGLVTGHLGAQEGRVQLLVRSGPVTGKKTVLPPGLQDCTWVDVRTDPVDRSEWMRLVYHLHGQGVAVAPLGPAPAPPTLPVSSFAVQDGIKTLSDEAQLAIQTAASRRTLVPWHRGDLVGQGRWRLGDPADRGGFGEVWQAYDLAQRRKVAIKDLRSDTATDLTAVQRFFRGARAMARLGHPHIVQVIDPGREEGGHGYFVMEWLNGGDLEQHLAKKPQTLEELLVWLVPIGSALTFAHEKGRIHRDVKPSNILLTEDGTPKLTDFDLVYADDLGRNTRTGQAVGSFLYAAPEVLLGAQPKSRATPTRRRGKNRKVDARSDVFSLAMTAVHALLGGGLPTDFQFEREAYLQELSERVPAGVIACLLQATSRTIEDRPVSVKAFVEAVQTAAHETSWPFESMVMPPVSTEGPPRSDADMSPSVGFQATVVTGHEPIDVIAVAASETSGPPSEVSKETPRLDAVPPNFEDPPDARPSEVDDDMERKILQAVGVGSKRWGRGLLLILLIAASGLGYRYWPRTYEFPIEVHVEAMAGADRSGIEVSVAALDDSSSLVRQGTFGAEDILRLTYEASENTEVEVTVHLPTGVQADGELRRRFVLQPGASGDPQGVSVTGIRLHNRTVRLASTPHRPRMIPMASGTFTMGSPDDEPGRDNDEVVHEVTLTRGFWLSESEVTQAQWKAAMGNNPSQFRTDPDLPVETVNWFEALAYANAVSDQEGLEACYTLNGCKGDIGSGCQERDEHGRCEGDRRCAQVVRKPDCTGYRLPTEAEWEYAARAGTTTALYTGPIVIQGQNNAPAVGRIGWYGGNSGVSVGGIGCGDWPETEQASKRCGTHPVMKKDPHPWGLYDMIGNVWEWTEDAWQPDLRTLTTDPTIPWQPDWRVVVRGCGWYSSARGCRAAFRYGAPPAVRSVEVGIRLARSSLDP